MKAIDFSQYEKPELVNFVQELHTKFEQKKRNLQEARNKLQTARKQLTRLKQAIAYQQKRIIELS